MISAGTEKEKKPRRDEGTIARHPDGKRWIARVQYTKADGRRSDKKKTVVSFEKAKAALKDLRTDIELEFSERKTFSELDKFFRKEYVHAAKIVGGRKISGFKQDTRIIERYLDVAKEYFGERPIDEITFADLKDYKNQLLNTPTKHERQRSVADVNQNLRRLRRLLNVAVEQDWLIKNPFNQGKGLIADSHEVARTTVLSPEDEKKLIDACSGFRAHLRPLVIFALDTAARRNEILAAKWFDLDFDAGAIRIRNKTSNVETTRLVPMPSRLRNELILLKEKSIKNDSFVFDVGDFKKAWAGATKAAGLNGLHFHDLRHTGITRWLEKGVSVTDAMKASGHTQIKTFMRYVNQYSGSMRSFNEKLDKAA